MLVNRKIEETRYFLNHKKTEGQEHCLTARQVIRKRFKTR